MNKLLEKIEETTDYQEQARLFLEETKTDLTWEWLGLSDRFKSGIPTLEYRYTLKRGSRIVTGLFNSSQMDLAKMLGVDCNRLKYLVNPLVKAMATTNMLNNLKERSINAYLPEVTGPIRIKRIEYPTSYDLLACLTKNDPESIDEFIACYGYELNDKTKFSDIQKTYDLVLDEWNAIKAMFNDEEIEALQAIN